MFASNYLLSPLCSSRLRTRTYFVYLPTCRACSVAGIKEQGTKAACCDRAQVALRGPALRAARASCLQPSPSPRPNTWAPARRRGTGWQAGGWGGSPGAQGLVPPARQAAAAATARLRSKQNRFRYRRGRQAGRQYLPAPARRAAALPSAGAPAADG